MAFPTPNQNNLRRQLNTPARQRLAAMRGQMFPQQNPALQPPAPPQPTNRSAAPKPPQNFNPEQTAALQGLSQQFGGIAEAGQNLGANVSHTPPPPRGTPPGQVGPGQVTNDQADNAPYMNEDYLRVQAREEQRRQAQLALINQQRQALGVGYGLGEFGGDAETNPYSRAAMLQRGYDRNQRASTNSLAASGQLYSGSLSNARNFNRFNFDAGFDSLRKQYDAALAGLSQQELNAQTRYDDALEAARRGAVDQGQIDEAYTPEEAPEPQPKANQPNPKKAGKASKGRIKTARQRINKLRGARAKAKNPKQRQRLTKRIQANKQTINRNQKRLQNIKQGKRPNQGIKPRPKPKKGKK